MTIFASNPLTTCNRLVIIKPKRAMRTRPNIGLMICGVTFKDVRQPARYFLTSTSLPNRNFNDKCVRCLKEFVSTTLRCDTPQSCSDMVNVNKNL